MFSQQASLLVVLAAGSTIGCHRTPGAPAPSSQPPPHRLLPPAVAGDLPCDSKDQKPVIVGITTRARILAHRPAFQADTDKAVLSPGLLKRWKELSAPCTLLVAFGSWCGDSQRELPDFLALMAEDNPFVKVVFLGVYRDKKVSPGVWPEGLEAQAVVKVPTFWLYALQPGGSSTLVGSIVENPPKKGQSMAEAVVELLERVP